MIPIRFALTLLTVGVLVSPVFAQKDKLPAAVDVKANNAWKMALQIWEWAEPGYLETKSSKLLADDLEKAGFKVERGVAKIPTAFTATFGSGSPVIGILGEYDALPELAQEGVPFREIREGGTGCGHACGHHLFGVASATAAKVIAEQIQDGHLKGTIRFYGCPAEEGGAAKAFMVRDGLFADCDAVLHWHPGSRNVAGDSSCLARIAVKFRFQGTPAHASGSPEKGRSALDALVLTMHAVELLREHTPEGTRLHHTVTAGGGAANVVPEFAEGFFYLRHPKAETVRKLYPRLVKCAEAGALATETKLEVVPLGGTMELLPNDTLAQVTKRNLKALNTLKYDEDELKFAVRLRDTFGDKPPAIDDIKNVSDTSGKTGSGSTDVGDVSWVVPTAGFGTACWVPGTPGHSWQAVACGRTTIGKKGMLLAANTLAASAWDLFREPETLKAAKAELKKKLGGTAYQPLLEKDQKPPLDYRLPPKRKSGE
jgi:aminobenzoyl-glutamate utilization protein B